jgi:putative cardiolipin synthase
MNTFLITLALLVLAYFFFKWYYRMPDISSRTVTYGTSDGVDTNLGKTFKPVLEKNTGKTGVRLLSNGLDAFVGRVAMAMKAEKTIDLQYYMYHQDTVGNLLLQELFDAADRGVRVRMLIDDIYGSKSEDLWIGLDAHPKIEVRLWNPWKRNRNWLIQGAIRFGTVNYRMHQKSFTVDNMVTVLGGRNIGDEYFDADPDLAFNDLDVLAIGPSVDEVTLEFDRSWNSEHSYPVDILIAKGTQKDLDTLQSSTKTFYENNLDSAYVQALKNSDLSKEIKAGTVTFDWAEESKVIYDSTEKMETGKKDKDGLLISQLEYFMNGAKKTVDISSPYFVPGKDFADKLCTLGKDGVKVRVLTNSLASNDVTAVHAGYSKYRRPLLRCGVELYELDESLMKSQGKTFTWLPGLKKSSLHAKTMVFDGEYMFIGSFNFDERSLYINNEIGLLFKDKTIAGKAAKHFEDNVGKVAFKVEFQRKGGNENLKWVGGLGGPDVVMTKEPYATTTQKLIVGILKWLPIDSQL